MSIDYNVSLGTLIEIGTSIGGLVVMGATFRERLARLVKRDDARDMQHEENQDRFKALELQIERECVKKGDFSEFERRLDEKLVRIEHSMANAATKAAGLFADIVDAAERRRRRRRIANRTPTKP